MRRTDAELDWAAEALCKGHAELFFGPLNERPGPRAARERAAKALCARCPALEPCRQFAHDHHEQGVWGGETDDERRAAKRRAVSIGGSSGR